MWLNHIISILTITVENLYSCTLSVDGIAVQVKMWLNHINSILTITVENL